MQALDLLLNRVSVGRLLEPAPDAAQRELMFRAALRAPAHGQLRPWRFITVDGEARARLGELFAEAQAQEAQRVAAIVDECVDNAATLLHGRLLDRLQVVIHDVTDSPNGFANVVPYNRVELRTITPDDTSELARSDDWLRLLVQHEVLHIVHLDVIHGLPAVVNLVMEIRASLSLESHRLHLLLACC